MSINMKNRLQEVLLNEGMPTPVREFKSSSEMEATMDYIQSTLQVAMKKWAKASNAKSANIVDDIVDSIDKLYHALDDES